MFSKIVAFALSVVMFFSSIFPGLFKFLGIGEKVVDVTKTVIEYTEKNLPVFAKAFSTLGMAFKASAIEDYIACTVILPNGDEDDAVYVDFNGNFGYMVMSEDYYIYAYKSEGDIELFKEKEKLYYSLTDGFGDKDENGEFVPYDLDETQADKTRVYEYIEEYFNYVSQDGSLGDTDKYVKKQYGDGYKMAAELELKNFDYTTQMSTSIYKAIPKEGYYTSEGNCSLQSIYAMLSYYQKKAGSTTPMKYAALPSRHQLTRIYANKDPFFDEFKDNESYKIEGYNRKTGVCIGFTVPALYKTIRTFCIENYGYKTGGTLPDNFKHIVQNVFETYNIEPTPLTEHIDFKTFQSVVVPHIKKGLPVLWSMSVSSTYGSHTAVITGYRIYTKFVESNGLKILTDKVILLKLNDNWSTDGNTFDYTRYTAATGTFYTLDT